MKKIQLFLSVVSLILILLSNICFAEMITWNQASFSDSQFWWFVKDHSGFYTRCFEGSNGFKYSFSEDSITQWCIWARTFSGTKKFKVFAYIPNPDPFDPTPNGTWSNNYNHTSSALYHVFDNDGNDDYVKIDQNYYAGGWAPLGTYTFTNLLKVSLCDKTDEGYYGKKNIAFDAIKFEPVEEKPDTPSLVSPNHGATNISRTTQLDWSYVSGVTYRVQVSRYSSFSSKIINTTTSSSYYNVPSGNLNYATKYYWRVRSEQNNQYSDYQSRYFTTENAPCYSPQSDFSGSPRSGVAPLSVSFSDNSSAGTGSIDSWSWNFGDGGSSTSQNPSYRYNSSGTYTVKLTVTNSCGGQDTETKYSYISVSEPCYSPTANFYANTMNGVAPLSVSFSDNSSAGSGSINSWSWSFGDGSSSSSRNPTHRYNSSGTYTVKLTVTNSCGQQDTETKYSYISVSEPCYSPTANFYANTTKGESPLSIEFSDNSSAGSGSIASWTWDFGDGGSSTRRNPRHEYNSSGIYTVKLTVTNSCGKQDSEIKYNYINVSQACNPPTANFYANTTSGKTPLNVSFYDS